MGGAVRYGIVIGAEVAHGKGGDVEDAPRLLRSANCINGPASEHLHHLFEVIIGDALGFQGHVCVRMLKANKAARQ